MRRLRTPPFGKLAKKPGFSAMCMALAGAGMLLTAACGWSGWRISGTYRLYLYDIGAPHLSRRAQTSAFE